VCGHEVEVAIARGRKLRFFMNTCEGNQSTCGVCGWIARSIAIGLSYFAIGQCSRILSLPPDLPSAIWPAAGVALAAVLIWGNLAIIGVFLGAWATNGISSYDPDAIGVSLSVGLGMASGASLQAWTGAVLMRRTVGFPSGLTSGQEIARFFVYSGPVNCIVGATVGVTTLWLAGFTAAESVTFNWFTWWVGDSIGTIVAAPIMLMLFAKSPAIWRRRRMAVAVPLIGCLVVVVAAFLSAKKWEDDRQYFSLVRQAAGITAKIDRAIQENVAILRSVSGLYAASDDVTKEEFHAFAEQWSAKRSLQALEWVPRVLAADRATWERRMGSADNPLCIRERSEDGHLVTADARADYFPVTFLEPFAGNESAIGYDLGSNKDRRNALEGARDTGNPTATPPVQLVQKNDSQLGVLVFVPIYSQGSPCRTIEERRENLRGFALGVFRLGDLACDALTDERLLPVRLSMVDVLAANQTQPHQVVDLSDGPQILESHTAKTNNRLPIVTNALEIAGRRWQLEIAATPEFSGRHRIWSIWMVLTGGMLFATLVVAFLLFVTARTEATDQLVEQRTRELALATSRAEAATSAKTEFLTSMSHELRTPLTAILGFAEAVQAGDDRDRFSSETKSSLSTISRNGEHLLSLISNILDVSKIEAGKLEIEPRPISLFELIDDVTDLMSLRAVEENLELRLGATTKLPDTVMLDPVRIRQILVNLLGNALKFTESGIVQLDVSVVGVAPSKDGQAESSVTQSSVTGASLEFCVSDSGIGMTAEQLAHIFLPFEQADASTTRKFGGTGLGLTISRRLAQLLGGEITVESKEGVGSRFVVQLPVLGLTPEIRWLSHAEYVTARDSRNVTSKPDESLQPLEGRVLLAEDGVDNQCLISLLLRRANVEVTLVENGRDAVDTAMADQTAFDLILMDMQMPILDGLGAVRELRSRDYRGPIVALTANAMSGDREQCIDAGCDGYTTKPINRVEFLGIVAKYVNAARKVSEFGLSPNSDARVPG
jgi:signal transduction histidine kinase/integral membrane sensor domain MASE1/ActR/RegA family two-component response regulator